MVLYTVNKYPFVDYTNSTTYDGTAESSVRDRVYGNYIATTQTNVWGTIIEILIKPEEVFYITLFLILVELHLILEFFAYMIRAPPIQILL